MFNEPILFGVFPVYAVPVGVFLGLLLVRALEKHQADRKIWYALLVVIGTVSALNPAGIVI